MDSTPDSTQLDSTLIDVRKAYRLLYLYQRRVMDLAHYIGSKLDFRHAENRSSYCFTQHPKIVKHHHWAWDLLPMYNMAFVFHSRRIEGFSEEGKLFINIVSDTGFYDSEVNNKLEINQFCSPENAATELHLVLTLRDKIPDEYHSRFQKQGETTMILESASDSTTASGIWLVGKKFPLTDFLDEESTNQSLEKFIGLCQENGITLSPTPSKPEEEETAYG